jgi:SAM-dependent methyltransferase
VPLFRAPLPGLETRQRFDVIAAFDVLEHIPNLDGALDNLERLLVPGGLLAFTVPVYDGPLGSLVDRLDKDETHVHRRGRDFWLDRLAPRFQLKHYTGVWRYPLPGVYINRVSRVSRRVTTAILVLAEKPAAGRA